MTNSFEMSNDFHHIACQSIKKVSVLFRYISFVFIISKLLTFNAFAGEISITATTFDRVPAKISQTGLYRSSVSQHYIYKDPFEFQITSGLHLFVEVTNSSLDDFTGSISYNYLIDPTEEKYDWETGGSYGIYELKAGEKRNCVIGIRPNVFLSSNIKPGTWKFRIELEEGTNQFNKNVIDSKFMAFEVIPDSKDTANGPSAGTIIPITYTPDTTRPWLDSLDLWSELFKKSPICPVVNNVSEFFAPYQEHLKSIEYINDKLISAAFIRVREGSLVGDKRTLIVEWKNDVNLMSAYFDRCLVGVKLPSKVKIYESKNSIASTDYDGNTVLLWDFLKTDKRITPNYGETIEFVIRETPSKILVEATAILMMGPYQYHDNWPGEIKDISMQPWIINWGLWNSNPEQVCWYALSGDTHTHKVSGGNRRPVTPKNLRIRVISK